jgi:predicted DNA-binding protein (UPF0251 family)
MSRRQVLRKCGAYEGVRPSCLTGSSHAEGTRWVLGADEMEALRLSDLRWISLRVRSSASSQLHTAKLPCRSWTTVL